MTTYDTLLELLDRLESEAKGVRKFAELLAEQESQRPIVLPHERESGFYPRHVSVHANDRT